MRGIVQKLDFRSSGYARPNQTWTCGREAEGLPCVIGPDARGGCQADFECRPAKRGDRWHCTRSDMSGGRCEHGPLPDGTCCKAVPRCRPVINWRARPGAMARRVAALTFGLLLILIAGGGPAFIDPGPLTFQHAKIENCAGCHTAFEKKPTSWVQVAFSENAVVADSKRCLACHDLGTDSLGAHALSPARTEALGRTVNPPSSGSLSMVAASAAAALDRPHEDGAALGCMTCHQEHQGSSADLSVMSTAQCQVCHSAQFASLSDGHPEFESYPFQRRTRIRFDHISHIGKHFRDKAVRASAPRECKGCHTPDTGGNLMLVTGFEDGCAACHGGQVQGVGRATAKGLSVFNVPGLDVATLWERNAFIGGWPEDADEEMTPFMDFLLAGNDRYGVVRKTLKGIDLLDLTEASDDQVNAVRDLAWLVKELLFDIATDGGIALKARLEKALGRPLSVPDLIDLTGLLPVDAMRAAQANWFPDLYGDITQHRSGEPSAAGNDAGDKNDKDTKEDGGGLLADDKDDKDTKEDGGGLLVDDKDTKEDDGGLLVDDKDDKDDGGLLADDKDGKEGGGLLVDDKDDKDGGGLLADDKDGKKDGLEPENLASGEDWSSAGGWYLDDFVLRYRPAGHGDRFVKAWLDATGAGGGLGDTKSPGLCAKCHSIDGDDKGVLTVNWRARRPVEGERPFTAFFHKTHFSLLDEKGCLTCHDLNPEAPYSQSYKDRNPMTFASNFKSVERKACVNCHTPKEAGDNCLTCHNYHIGTFRPPAVSTSKMMSLMGDRPR